MKYWATIIWAATATVVYAAHPFHPPMTSLESFYGTAQRLEIVQHADTTEIELLRPKGGKLSDNIADYDVLQRVKLGAAETRRLSAILVDPKQYRWPDEILPDGRVMSQVGANWHGYHAAIILQHEGQTVTLGVSFLWFIAVLENGKPSTWAFLTSSHADLFRFVFALFPDDPHLIDRRQQLDSIAHIESQIKPAPR